MLAIFLGLIVIVGAALYFVAGHQTHRIQNEGYTYSVDFPASHSNEANGIRGLLSDDGDLAITITPSKSNTEVVCTATVSKVTDITINSTSRPLCQSGSGQAYLTSFETNSQWHTVFIVSPTNKTVSTTGIANILSTITVSKN